MRRESRPAARVHIERALLARLLGLPEGCDILAVEYEVVRDHVTLVVEAPGLPATEPGERYRSVRARYGKGHGDRFELRGFDPL